MAKPRPDINVAFRSRYRVVETGCWEWTGSKDKDGYGEYIIEKIPLGGGRYSKRKKKAHRLAWELLRGPIPEGLEVCHSCDVTGCVNPDHLFLATHKQNMGDRDWKGRQSHGTKHYLAELTEKDVINIRKSDEPLRVLAKRYGISIQSVSEARNGKTWKHVKETAGPRAPRTIGAKLSIHDIPRIRKMHATRYSLVEIAEIYDVTPEQIGHIINGKSWKHVP